MTTVGNPSSTDDVIAALIRRGCLLLDAPRAPIDFQTGIWAGSPSSALVVRRFLEFDGVGTKIATMAANILVREFNVPLRDLSAIDISPDSRVTRFFKERGLLRVHASAAELIYLARELSPDFPGLLDYAAFIEGDFKKSIAEKAQQKTRARVK